MVVGPDDFGLRVLSALGISLSKVRGFEIRCFAGEIPTIRIEKFVEAEQDATALGAAFESVVIGKVLKSEIIELEQREVIDMPNGKVGS